MTPRTTACPSCGASARADAAFCGQCYADFRPPPPPPVIPSTPPPTASYGVPAPDPLTAPLAEVLPTAAAPTDAAEVTWPCTTCGVGNPLSFMTCSACGAGFLAAARSETSLVLPVVGDIGAMSRGKRVAVASGLVAALLVPLALLTLLLTKHPPADSGPQAPLPITDVSSAP